MADEHQLQQAFVNVIINAEQAMVEAHGGGNLHVTALMVGDKIRLSFVDDGPGIPPDHQQRIFTPFFTTKGVGKGTGLGLSICHGIIRDHGGSIWAESQLAEGTTFHIELPVLSPEAAPDFEAREVPSGSSLKQRILVVDDEPVIRDLLFQVLTGDGNSVELAADGQQAWEMIRANTYGFIVIDLKMPGTSGQQLYQLIRGFDPKLCERIIFITGDMARPGVRDFLEATGSPVLGKPFNLDELRRQLQRFVPAER